MRMRKGDEVTIGRRTVLKGLAAAPLALATGAARAAERTAVDLQLVLAVDASASISKGLLDFQLRGHAAAFRHPGVVQAIRNGPHGQVAAVLTGFAGPDSLTTLVPWTVLRGPEDCEAFARAIDAAPGVSMGGSTALGSAVIQAVRQIESAPYAAAKRTIDLVSNGFNNAGIDPLTARAHAAAAGVGINALAILDEFDWLEEYYQENVIVGDGCFVRTATGPDDFAGAFLAKLVAEIA